MGEARGPGKMERRGWLEMVKYLRGGMGFFFLEGLLSSLYFSLCVNVIVCTDGGLSCCCFFCAIFVYGNVNIM